MQKGKLILFPVGLGGELEACLPAYNTQLLNTCTTFIVEELRTARRFLKKAGYLTPIDDTTFFVLNEHTHREEIEHYLDGIAEGKNIGVLSEAGLPCVADPGAMAVRLAQQRGIEVVPLVGPSSLMMALMASGFNGQNFAFVGYLPIDRPERIKAVKALESRALRERQTQIFIETPYRSQQTIELLANTCNPNTMICVATDITLETQFIKSATAAWWKKHLPDIAKRNTVFLIGNS
jgi:16S rRNA (cytidine1402-2'-O)-methyltransferase